MTATERGCISPPGTAGRWNYDSPFCVTWHHSPQWWEPTLPWKPINPRGFLLQHLHKNPGGSPAQMESCKTEMLQESPGYPPSLAVQDFCKVQLYFLGVAFALWWGPFSFSSLCLFLRGRIWGGCGGEEQLWDLGEGTLLLPSNW